MRIIPELRFFVDDSLDYIEKIEDVYKRQLKDLNNIM